MLLRGPSGAGKSDLAVQAMQAGWRLVADDRVIVWPSSGRVFGRAPTVLHGLVEARGQAIVRVAAQALTPIGLVVDLAGAAAEMERLPEPGGVELAGLTVPHATVRAGEASILARLELALQAIDSPAAKAPL